jgi:hypothetical protein
MIDIDLQIPWLSSLAVIRACMRLITTAPGVFPKYFRICFAESLRLMPHVELIGSGKSSTSIYREQ